jgi:hypothetical protein
VSAEQNTNKCAKTLSNHSDHNLTYNSRETSVS